MKWEDLTTQIIIIKAIIISDYKNYKLNSLKRIMEVSVFSIQRAITDCRIIKYFLMIYYSGFLTKLCVIIL